jgi:hypothetical protein
LCGSVHAGLFTISQKMAMKAMNAGTPSAVQARR